MTISLPNTSVIFITSCLYLAPIIVNIFFSIYLTYYKDIHSYKRNLIFPSVSTIYFNASAILFEGTGLWPQFANTINSVSASANESVVIFISPKLFDLSQILFALLLYFSITLLTMLILRKLKGNSNY